MPLGRERRPVSASAKTLGSYVLTGDSRILAPRSHGVATVAATLASMALSRSECSSLIRGEFSTCTVTFGNGLRIAGHQTRRKFRPTAPPHRDLEAVKSA